ncbi:GIY-YIG nuclease family protein [Viridibacillus sp. NPDC096237]|uniref:GIY-YIG nuclease family protein n=1 Tax=Viridibacillus sp. NPDC096237 TaxID=3390721 RepID=UPI003CFF349B
MIIYKILNKLNGKVYIGQTNSTLEQRLSQHLSSKKSLVSKSIIKYGIDSFDISIIDEADNRDGINEKEKYWIKYYDSIAPKGYNLDAGGYDASPSVETRKKISNTLKGRYAGKKNPMYGKESPMKGKIGAMKGKKHLKSTIQKMSLSRSGANSKVATRIKNIDTGEVFISQKEASDKYGISRTCICAACKGRQKKAGGFRWSYVE